MSKKQEASRGYRIIYALLAWLVGILFNIKVVGAENEPDDAGCLVCANHVSATDPIVICYAFRKNQVHMMAKKELFKVPLLSGLIKMLGAFPVDRGGVGVGALKKSIAMIKEGKHVGVFPQGHRYVGVDPRETPVKKGVGLIAARAECDVIPVYVARKNNKFLLFRRTRVIIGKRIEWEELEGLDHEALTKFVFDRICDIGEEDARNLQARKSEKHRKHK